MKTVEFIPSACKVQTVEQINPETGATEVVEIQPKFEGKIILIVPTNEQRMSFLEHMGVEIGADGKVEQKLSNIAILRKMIHISKDHYKEVALKNLVTGEELKSFDDLNYDDAASEIMSEVATVVVQGFKIPKNSKA